VDTSQEFINAAFKPGAHLHGVELPLVQRQAHAECLHQRFNRTYRTNVLDRYDFTTLADVRHITKPWQHRCNHDRPHLSVVCHSSACRCIISHLLLSGESKVRARPNNSHPELQSTNIP
jgi:hypothetical protein